MKLPCWAAVLISAFSLLSSSGSKLRSNELEIFKGYKQTLYNHGDAQYVANFRIGGQEIAAIFDTGSSDVLVRSSKCKYCANPTKPFDANKSKTYRTEGIMKRYSFGSGNCLTQMAHDTVELGGVLKAEDQAIYEIVDHYMPVLDSSKFAAVVGIGVGHSFNSTEKTLLMNYNVDDFSVCLQRAKGSVGFLHWGPHPKQLHPTQMIHARVLGKHYWATRMRNVSFPGRGKGDDKKEPVSVCSDSHGCSAILDSGTSLIAGPTKELQKLAEQIGWVNENCSNLHELPHLSFQLDGQRLELPPQAYVVRVKGASVDAYDIWDLLFFKPKIRKLDQCTLGFMAMDLPSRLGPVWILGMPFFRYFHTTFDRKSMFMRIAKAGKDCDPEPIQESFEEQKQKLDHDVGSKSLFVSFGADHDVAYQPLDVDANMVLAPWLSFKSGQVLDI